MGISYNWNADRGTVDVTGVCSDDDLGSATIEVSSLMRRMKKLSIKDDLTEEEEDELNILENFIEIKDEDDEDN